MVEDEGVVVDGVDGVVPPGAVEMVGGLGKGSGLLLLLEGVVVTPLGRLGLVRGE